MTDYLSENSRRPGWIGMKGPTLIFWSMIVASAALSVGSFYTTWIGMMEFVGTDAVGGSVAFIITFGVQALLYAISWRIAESWRLGRAALLGSIAMWTICAFVSMFFSFYGFFNTQGGRNESVRRQAVTNAAMEVLTGVQERIDARLKTDREGFLADGGPYRDWLGMALDPVIEVSRRAEIAIREAARREAGLRREAVLEKAAQRREIDERKAVLARRASSSEQDLVRLRAEVEGFRKSIAGTEAELTRLGIAVTAKQEEADKEAATGRGRRYNQLVLDLNSLTAARDAAATTLAGLRQELANRLPGLSDLEAIVGQGGTAAEIGRLDSEIARIDAEIAADEKEIERLTGQQEFSVEEEIRKVGASRIALERGTYDTYEAMVTNCASLADTIRTTSFAAEIKAIKCASPEVAQAIQGLKAALERRATFASDCIDAAPSVEAARADPLIDFALSCVQRFDPDGRRRAEADSALGDLRARRGDDANPITKAGVALLSDVQSNAIIALLLAVFVDLLVLLCAIVGRHAGTSERVRAIDEITRAFRPSPDLERFEAIYELPADRNLRRIVDDVVTLLFRENLATYLSENDSSRIGLLKGARERLAAERAREQGETIAVLRPLQPGSRDRPALPPRRTIRNPG